VIRNLNKLDRVPDKLREQIFDKLFETAEIARFTQEQVRSYEDSLKYYRDLKNSLDTARDEGKIEGKMEGKMEIATKALKKGLSVNDIIELTGLSEDEIKKLK
jgi:predicted transposase/invertase (TIGR01784 family)